MSQKWVTHGQTKNILLKNKVKDGLIIVLFPIKLQKNDETRLDKNLSRTSMAGEGKQN